MLPLGFHDGRKTHHIHCVTTYKNRIIYLFQKWVGHASPREAQKNKGRKSPAWITNKKTGVKTSGKVSNDTDGAPKQLALEGYLSTQKLEEVQAWLPRTFTSYSRPSYLHLPFNGNAPSARSLWLAYPGSQMGNDAVSGAAVLILQLERRGVNLC